MPLGGAPLVIVRDLRERETGRMTQRVRLLWQEGWDISRSRVERIWKPESLRVPRKQPKRGRLWLANGSRVRPRPTHRNHGSNWDFVMDRTDDGRPVKILTLIDEFTKEALAVHPARRIRANDVIEIFVDVMIERGIPEHIRSDNDLSSESNRPPRQVHPSPTGAAIRCASHRLTPYLSTDPKLRSTSRYQKMVRRVNATSTPNSTLRTTSEITCPHCGVYPSEEMPSEARIYYFKGSVCGAVLTPEAGDCCAFCSYGSVPCPPVQTAGKCCFDPGPGSLGSDERGQRVQNAKSYRAGRQMPAVPEGCTQPSLLILVSNLRGIFRWKACSRSSERFCR